MDERGWCDFYILLRRLIRTARVHVLLGYAVVFHVVDVSIGVLLLWRVVIHHHRETFRRRTCRGDHDHEETAHRRRVLRVLCQ